MKNLVKKYLFFLSFLSHLLVAGCDIGVRFSVRRVLIRILKAGV